MENPKESKKILLHMSGCLLVSMLLDGMNQWVLARGSLLTKAFWIKGMPTRLRKGVPGKSPGFVHNPGASANGLLKIDCERWPQNIQVQSILTVVELFLCHWVFELQRAHLLFAGWLHKFQVVL